MQFQTDDLRINGQEEVIAPARLIEKIAPTRAASECIFSTRRAISDIVHGRDPRLLVAT